MGSSQRRMLAQASTRRASPEKMIFWLSTEKPWSAWIFFLRSATCAISGQRGVRTELASKRDAQSLSVPPR